MATVRRGAVGRALETALGDGGWRDQDAATVELARTYARMVDASSEQAVKCGPLLLAVLVELGMTPRARAAVVKGGQGDSGNGGSRLDELRRRREDRAASVDSSSP